MLKKLSAKVLIPGLLLLCWVLPAKSQNAVKMTDSNGKETIFLLSSKPSVTHTGKSCVVENNDGKVEYEIGGGVRF